MTRKLLIALLAAGALAGCGSSTSPQAHQTAVNYCVYGDSHGGGTGDRSSCECAVTGLEKQGYSDQKILAESKDNTAMLSDTKLIRISLLCAGH